jgi:hypothetical protein
MRPVDKSAELRHERPDMSLPATQLLKALCDAIGALPVSETDQATRKAYSAATNYLDPDEFTERFMAGHKA